MQAIKYLIEKYPSFETVEDKRITNESDPQEFSDLLRVFSGRHPHLLDGEQVAPQCMTSFTDSSSNGRLSRDCFSVDVNSGGDVSVFCQYKTTHQDGERMHTYLLSTYAK